MGFARNYISDSSITRFPEFGATCQIFLRMMINYLFQLSKPARMWLTVQHRGISSIDLAWLVWDNHLSCEASCFHPWVLFAVTSHMTTTNIFDRQVLFFLRRRKKYLFINPLLTRAYTDGNRNRTCPALTQSHGGPRPLCERSPQCASAQMPVMWPLA